MTSERQYLFPKHYADEVQRLRVPLGFVMVAAFAWFSAPGQASLTMGLPVAALGIAIRAWAAGCLAKNQTLAREGPYAAVRNPLYVGTVTAALGFAIAGANPWLGLAFATVFAMVYLPAIELEEQHLRKLFPEYAQYASEVPMLAPRVPGRGWTSGFRWSLYFRNQEYQALAGFVAGAAFLIWKAGLL